MKSVNINKLSLFFLLLLIVNPLNAQKIFTMAFKNEPSKDPQYKFYERIYTEAFKELGYKFEYKIFPSKRASLLANSGKIDGEPQRIYSYVKKYENLIRVEEPIFTNRTLAFTVNPKIKIENLNNLKNTSYKVEYLRGSIWSKNKLTPLISNQNLSEIETIKQGFKRLTYKRTDVFIALEVLALKTLQDNEFDTSNINISSVIGENYSYPYLHKSHSKLAIHLAKILKEMKEDGRYKKIYQESMPFLEHN